MKKILSTLLVAACLLVAIPAQAQLKFGVKGGLNLSKLDVKDFKGNEKNYTGFFIGPMAEFTLPVIGLGVDGALMYSQKGGKIEYDGVSETLEEKGLEIPVNLKYSIGLGSLASVYLAAGPSFFFNFEDYDLDDVFDDADAKKAQVSLNLGAGVKLVKHLQVGVNYNIPLNDSFTLENIVDGVTSKSKTKTKTWQVSVAYIF